KPGAGLFTMAYVLTSVTQFGDVFVLELIL
ncbi:MAG: hypothetical protein ACJAS9_002982, partial [Polaribacter sp.]